MNEQDPLRGTRGGQIPSLTPAQHSLAAISDGIAEDLMRELAVSCYFTTYRLKQMPAALEPLLTHGILTIHKSQAHDGNYYKPTNLTRAWCLASLALAQERKRLYEQRATDGAGR